MTAAVFVVRYGVWAVKPMAASDALECFLDQHAQDNWHWDAPRWADSSLRMMSVIFTDADLAKTVLEKWVVPR